MTVNSIPQQYNLSINWMDNSTTDDIAYHLILNSASNGLAIQRRPTLQSHLSGPDVFTKDITHFSGSDV